MFRLVLMLVWRVYNIISGTGRNDCSNHWHAQVQCSAYLNVLLAAVSGISWLGVASAACFPVQALLSNSLLWFQGFPGCTSKYLHNPICRAVLWFAYVFSPCVHGTNVSGCQQWRAFLACPTTTLRFLRPSATSLSETSLCECVCECA